MLNLQLTIADQASRASGAPTQLIRSGSRAIPDVMISAGGGSQSAQAASTGLLRSISCVLR
jgi:hypothetical protein